MRILLLTLILCTLKLSTAKADPISCMVTATKNYATHNLSSDQMIQLCSGATSDAPVTCMWTATKNYATHNLSSDQMISLCKKTIVCQ